MGNKVHTHPHTHSATLSQFDGSMENGWQYMKTKKEWFFNLNFMLVHCMATKIRDGLCTVWICLSNTKVRTCFFTFGNGVI